MENHWYRPTTLPNIAVSSHQMTAPDSYRDMTEVLAKPATDLPQQVFRELGQRLHSCRTQAGDWVNLSELLGFSRGKIEGFEVQSEIEKETAGYLMLMEWRSHEDSSSLFVLRDSLMTCGRLDCVTFLDYKIEETLYMHLYLQIIDETDPSSCPRLLKVRTKCDATLMESLQNILGGDSDDSDYEAVDVPLLTKARLYKGKQITLRKRARLSEYSSTSSERTESSQSENITSMCPCYVTRPAEEMTSQLSQHDNWQTDRIQLSQYNSGEELGVSQHDNWQTDRIQLSQYNNGEELGVSQHDNFYTKTVYITEDCVYCGKIRTIQKTCAKDSTVNSAVHCPSCNCTLHIKSREPKDMMLRTRTPTCTGTSQNIEEQMLCKYNSSWSHLQWSGQRQISSDTNTNSRMLVSEPITPPAKGTNNRLSVSQPESPLTRDSEKRLSTSQNETLYLPKALQTRDLEKGLSTSQNEILYLSKALQTRDLEKGLSTSQNETLYLPKALQTRDLEKGLSTSQNQTLLSRDTVVNNQIITSQTGITTDMNIEEETKCEYDPPWSCRPWSGHIHRLKGSEGSDEHLHPNFQIASDPQMQFEFSNQTKVSAHTMSAVPLLPNVTESDYIPMSTPVLHRAVSEPIPEGPPCFVIADFNQAFDKASSSISSNIPRKPKKVKIEISHPQACDILRNFPGWSPEETEITVEQTMSRYRREDGHFIIWYMRSKKQIVLSVSHLGNLVHYAVFSEQNLEGQVGHYIFSNHKFPDLRSLLRFHMKNGVDSKQNAQDGDKSKRHNSGRQNVLSHVNLKYAHKPSSTSTD